MAHISRRPRAERDLLDIWQYIATASGDIDRADTYLDQLEIMLETLATQPRMGRQRDELREGLRSFGVGSYVVFYTPLDNGIDIVRVLHGSRDFTGDLFTDES